MKQAISTTIAAAFALCAFASPPWEDEQVSGINKLEARAILVPCESEAKARAIAMLEEPREASKWIESLNGEWLFTFYSGKEGDEAKVKKIQVPGCWQLQGEYDPPLYTNDIYPFAVRPPIASGLHPEIPAMPGDNASRVKEDWTINRFPEPIGIYEREWTMPVDWQGRRIVVHFGGVSSAMTLYVNGKEVGYSEDSRLPAEFDISPYLNETNTIRVEVRKFCDGSYLEDQDFWRLSGIFRDVWLAAEAKDGIKDMVVEASYDTGRVIVRDDAAQVVHEEIIERRVPWTPDIPRLYTIAFEKGGDWHAVNVGFRKVTIENGVLKLNGRRILIKGVNRHEISPTGGYAMTHEEMERDIKTIKEFGFNAVRTSHYPNDPYWYDLCDKYGIMLCSEANVEGHGMRHVRDWLSKHEEWRKSHVERAVNMVKTFRNHPSIIIWSLGNESGNGDNFKYSYEAMRSLDATRPIHYEGVMNYRHFDSNNISDIICPMYPSPAKVEECLKRDTAKPFIMCEYSHAMGNSTGNIDEYWALAEKYPTFQGGFIWDFADQALIGRDGHLKYGGDFSDNPNDGNFCCNGIFDAFRNPHPGAYEVKEVFASVCPAKCSQEFGFRPNLYRALTDNDRGWARKKPELIAPWKHFAETGELPEGCKVSLEEKGDRIDFVFHLAGEIPPPPRIGVSFTIPANCTNVTWIGRGPHENYPDRKKSAHFGEWSMNVDKLNASHYVRPGECGHRCDTSRLVLSDGENGFIIETCGASFGFNVWPWTQDDLEAAMHGEDMKKREFLTVNIDVAMMGVGGDDSWGAKPHDEYLPKPGDYRLSFTVKKFGFADRPAFDYSDTAASVYQWSVVSHAVDKDRPNGRAFLWIPEDCKKLRGVVIGQQNMIEEPIFETPTFREELAKADLGIIFIAPKQGGMWKAGEEEVKWLETVLNDLARVSGYDELATCPIALIGHSAMAMWPYMQCAAMKERAFAGVSIKGAWADRKTAWASDEVGRNLAGIPFLLLDGEYEDAENRAAKSRDFCNAFPDVPFSFCGEDGAGHFDISDELSHYLGVYFRKAIDYLAQRRPGAATGGWLMERWKRYEAPSCVPAPAAEYAGDRRDAYWYFDEEMVRETEKLQERFRGRDKTPLVGIRCEGAELPQHMDHLQVHIPYNGGERFAFEPMFLDTVEKSTGGRFEDWTGLKEGDAAPHPADESSLHVQKICGPCAKARRR